MYNFAVLSLLFTSSIVVASQPQIQWVDCKKNVNPAFPLLYPTVKLPSKLPSTLHCGYLEVPMDYSKPISSTNNITLGIAMHRPQNPKGVIFYNPGGSDPAAVVAWQVALELNTDFSANFTGLLEYDLMFADIRGQWSSNPVNVSLEAAVPFFGSYPGNQAEFEKLKKESVELIKSFDKLSTPKGIIPFIGTQQTTQDYEMIRRALAYEKISFIGCSYGTYRAATYAATFPNRVDRFVLDAVTGFGQTEDEAATNDIIAANRALERADAYCQNTTIDCPFQTKGRGSVQRAFGEVLAKAKLSNIPACAKTAACKQNLAPWQVQAAVLTSLQGNVNGDTNFLKLFRILDQALEGDGTMIAALSSPKDVSLPAAWSVPYYCNDDRFVDKTFAGFKKSVEAATKYDTYSIHRSDTWQVRLLCSGWPYASEKLKNITLEEPMLFVTADFDQAAATEGTTIGWSHAPNSSLVVRHGDDHVSFNLPLQESTRLSKEFLRTGVLPSPRNETLTTIYAPGTERAPVYDPYLVATGFDEGDVLGA